MNQLKLIFQSTGLVLGAAALLLGCASPQHQQAKSDAASQAVARMLATSSAGALVFKDLDAASNMTCSISGLEQFKFAMLLDKQGSKVASYFSESHRSMEKELTQAVTRKIGTGESELRFEEGSLSVCLAPVRYGGEVCGYAAIGSL